MIQTKIGFPTIGAHQALRSLVSGCCPHITIRIKEELVHTGFMWKKGLDVVTSTNELELTDLSVTSGAEYSRLTILRLGVKRKVQNTAEVAFKCLNSFAAGNVEDKHFGIRTPGN
jgi:hypothetical protein